MRSGLPFGELLGSPRGRVPLGPSRPLPALWHESAMATIAHLRETTVLWNSELVAAFAHCHGDRAVGRRAVGGVDEAVGDDAFGEARLGRTARRDGVEE